MSKPNLMIVGAGGVGAVAAHKAAQFHEEFGRIVFASRSLEKPTAIAAEAQRRWAEDGEAQRIEPRQLDARNLEAAIALLRETETNILLNVATPYCNTTLLDACTEAGVHYLDTAVAEDEHVENMPAPWYEHQEWPRKPKFEAKGLSAVLGIGFDPGVVNVMCAYAGKHLFDKVETIDIIDVNGGDHGKYFATNFDPDTNLREIMEDVIFWEDGEFKTIPHHSKMREVTLPQVGTHKVYSMGHDELHSLPRLFPEARRMEFWMGFGDRYLQVFEVLNRLGLTSSIPVEVEGVKLAPVKMVKAVLPDPSTLAPGYSGKVCIGCDIRGTRDGVEKRVFIYSNCDHRACYEEVGSQAISYTTGVPAISAAILLARGVWQPGSLVNVEELDPDPFLDLMPKLGIDWTVAELPLDGSWPFDALKADSVFAGFDPQRVPSPCHVIELATLEQNLRLLRQLADAAEVKVLLALKAFSCFAVADLVGDYLDGTAASGLWEARLGCERFGGEVHAYLPGLKPAQLAEIERYADHLIFNSLGQWQRFQPLLAPRDKAAYGLRVNPRHSEVETPRYDPCAAWSRLGALAGDLNEELLGPIGGLHVHALCDQGYAPFDRLLAATEEGFGRFFGQLDWINLGGGQLLTAEDYPLDRLIARLQDFKRRWGLAVYLEPGTAIALNAGALVTEVLDLGWNEGRFAILDSSATCHMPDVLEAPYTPDLLGAESLAEDAAEGTDDIFRLGGPTCLAGDVIGSYRFEKPPQVGERLLFLDQAYYTMVKSTTFNGTPLPAIALWDSGSDDLKIIREFGYESFEGRLS